MQVPNLDCFYNEFQVKNRHNLGNKYKSANVFKLKRFKIQSFGKDLKERFVLIIFWKYFQFGEF